MPLSYRLKFVFGFAVAGVALAAPLVAGQIWGKIRSIDRPGSLAVIHDEEIKKDVTISLVGLARSSSRLGEDVERKGLEPGNKVVVNERVVASSVAIDGFPV